MVVVVVVMVVVVVLVVGVHVLSCGPIVAGGTGLRKFATMTPDGKA